MNHFDQLAVGSAMDQSADSGGVVMADVRANPSHYMVSSPFAPSLAPAWSQEGAGECSTLLRVFACATKQGFSVLPGVLEITVRDAQTLRKECQEHQ